MPPRSLLLLLALQTLVEQGKHVSNGTAMIKPIAFLLLLMSLPCLALQPTPELSPADVVTYQLKSLQENTDGEGICLLYTSPSPRDGLLSRMPSSA